MLRTILYCLLLFGLLLTSCRKGSTDKPQVIADSLGTGWSKVDIGSGIFFVDIFFSGKTGFGISGNNILSYADGTYNWDTVFQGKLPLTNIAMGNADNAVFVSAQGGKIYYTNNGGESFDSTTVDDSGIYDAYFISENIAYALGDNIWKTTDAGRSWNHLYTFSTPNRWYKTLFFADEMNGWVSTSSGFFKTENGGITWEKYTSNLFSGVIGAIFFTDATTGYISNSRNILKTEDGGVSWKIIFTDPETETLDIHFLTKEIGYINSEKSIYKTSDGGLSWAREVKLGNSKQSPRIVELHFTDIYHGWASGLLGNVLKYSR